VKTVFKNNLFVKKQERIGKTIVVVAVAVAGVVVAIVWTHL